MDMKLENLESSSTKIMMNEPIECKLMCRKEQNKQRSLMMNFMFSPHIKLFYYLKHSRHAWSHFGANIG